MGLLQKIKSLLGLGSSGSKRDRTDVGVTVEREGGSGSRASTGSENAVKGTDAGTEPADDAEGSAPGEADEEAAGSGETVPDEDGTESRERDGPADAEAGGSTGTDDGGSTVDETGTDDGGSTVDETGTDDGGSADAGAEMDRPDADETEPDATGEDGTDADGSDPEAESRVPSEAVDVIKGIGPTYAGRLSDAGVETVADLAEADADDVAERADVPQGRLEDWIERAQARDR